MGAGTIIVVGIGVFLLFHLVNSKEMVCKDCGVTEEITKTAPGSLLIEIILWCCFLVPGLIYSIWRSSSRRYQCPKRSSLNVIPVDSPMAKQIAKTIEPNSAPSSSQAEIKAMWRKTHPIATFFYNPWTICVGALALIILLRALPDTPPHSQASAASEPERSHASASDAKQEGTALKGIERIVKTFKGNATENTRPFTVPGQWEIQWDTQGDSNFMVHLRKIGDRDFHESIANVIGRKKGKSFQPESGEYYLEIEGDGAWTVKIVSFE
jgi:hypothetical protein